MQPIQTPADLHITDKLLRSVNEFAHLMLNESQIKKSFFTPGQGSVVNQQSRAEIRRLQIRSGSNATAEAYDKAHVFLKSGQPEMATQKLRNAVSTVPTLFIGPDLFLLMRLIEVATWSTWNRFPGYEPVVFKFLAAESGKKLGLQHPLTHQLACFSEAAAISTSYPTLWTCFIDHIDHMVDGEESRAEAQNLRIQSYFYLVRVLRNIRGNNRDYFAAAHRCQELIQLCIAIDGRRSVTANRARYNLAVVHCEAGAISAALEAYNDAREYLGTGDAPYDGWINAVFAMTAQEPY